MKAGRELDALIAEKVMGTPKYWSVWFACSHYGNFNGLDQAQVYAEKIQGDFKAHVLPYSDEPNYSTSIAAAWEVVNHLLCHGWDEKHFFQLHYDNVDLWDASFYKESSSDGGGPEVWGTADSPALAICLAALKAVRN